MEEGHIGDLMVDRMMAFGAGKAAGRLVEEKGRILGCRNSGAAAAVGGILEWIADYLWWIFAPSESFEAVDSPLA